MATLNFTKEKDLWITRFTNTGNTIVQIEREKDGVVSVLAQIDGLQEVPIAQFQNGYTPNVIFQLNIPAGVNITIKSQTEVLKAATFVAQ